jgi:hypothetical protein
MNRSQTRVSAVLFVLLLLVVSSPLEIAGSHTWKFVEAFSNADGTVQFIEFGELNGAASEFAINTHSMSSNTKVFNIGGAALTGSTAFKRFLVATPAFAALPGAPTPDRILPAGSVPFFSRVNDTLACSGWPSMTFIAGQLPTDGIHSLSASSSGTCNPCTVTVNSPTNYAGATGSIDASTPPPAVPEIGTTPVTATKLDPAGSSLSVSFDTATCSDTNGHEIIYGSKSQLPAALGANFGVTGSVCTVGATSPYAWTSVPEAGDGSGLLWWLIVAKDGSNREGSWGNTSAGERNGPGTNGSSGQCGVTTKSVANACGH